MQVSGLANAFRTEREPVVVEGGGAGYWTFSVYYPSEDLANQQGDTKYEDLYYQ